MPTITPKPKPAPPRPSPRPSSSSASGIPADQTVHLDGVTRVLFTKRGLFQVMFERSLDVSAGPIVFLDSETHKVIARCEPIPIATTTVTTTTRNDPAKSERDRQRRRDRLKADEEANGAVIRADAAQPPARPKLDAEVLGQMARTVPPLAELEPEPEPEPEPEVRAEVEAEAVAAVAAVEVEVEIVRPIKAEETAPAISTVAPRRKSHIKGTSATNPKPLPEPSAPVSIPVPDLVADDASSPPPSSPLPASLAIPTPPQSPVPAQVVPRPSGDPVDLLGKPISTLQIQQLEILWAADPTTRATRITRQFEDLTARRISPGVAEAYRPKVEAPL